VEEKPDGTWLTLRRTGAPTGPDPVITCSTAAPGPLVVFMPSDSLGRGPAELGERLAAAYLHALLDVTPRPATIIFMNTGVKLAAEGSKALDDLRTLAEQGVDILACGTCLSYFDLTQKLSVGRVSNMYDIATALHGAGRLVSL
jgi:selenium metabolism protein YedF